MEHRGTQTYQTCHRHIRPASIFYQKQKGPFAKSLPRPCPRQGLSGLSTAPPHQSHEGADPDGVNPAGGLGLPAGSNQALMNHRENPAKHSKAMFINAHQRFISWFSMMNLMGMPLMSQQSHVQSQNLSEPTQIIRMLGALPPGRPAVPEGTRVRKANDWQV